MAWEATRTNRGNLHGKAEGRGEGARAITCRGERRVLTGARERGPFLRRSRRRPPSQDFGLTIDIDKLIRETDADGSGQVDYPEFKAMMA